MWFVCLLNYLLTYLIFFFFFFLIYLRYTTFCAHTDVSAHTGINIQVLKSQVWEEAECVSDEWSGWRGWMV